MAKKLNEKVINQLIENISSAGLMELAAELVRIPSYSFLERQEEKVGEYIRDWFTDQGISVELTQVLPGRFNVTAVLKGNPNSDKNQRMTKSLMLSGHLDTVPAYGMKDPFAGKISNDTDSDVKNDLLYGRGACDMKGALAAMMVAMTSIRKTGIRLKGDLLFTGLIDEEEEGKGVEYLIKYGPFAQAAIIGEPSKMKIALGHKGLEWMKIQVLGKKVHGGKMEEGINAIVMAAKLIDKIYGCYTEELKKRHHPVLGFPTINVGRIEGGDQPSTVPGICTLEIDRRWLPSETREQVYEELKELINSLEKEIPGFQARLSDMFEGKDLLPHLPFCLEEEEDLVRAAKNALEIAKGVLGAEELGAGELCSFPAWTDAGIIAANTDTKCIIMGPGDLALAHSEEESISTRELEEAAFTYALTAINYLGYEDYEEI